MVDFWLCSEPQRGTAVEKIQGGESERVMYCISRVDWTVWAV